MSTPYMSLDLPVVSTTLGPEWAELLNAALEVIDNHDHTAGRGRLVTSAALNINDDVSINNKNLEDARSYNMADNSGPLSDPADVRSLYAVSGELYYNDGIGNQIQITSGGALDASSVGGIGGDYGTSSANVYYSSVSKTFFFDQDTNKRAKLDIGDLIIRETATSANGITLKSPASLAADYQLTLPAALPASTLPVVISNTGVMSTQQLVASQLATDSVTTAKIVDLNVTTAKLADSSITAAKVNAASGIVKKVVDSFTSTTTWTCPPTVTFVLARGAGGGGGGGGGGGWNSGSSLSGGGGGGGAGAAVRSQWITVTPGNVYTITIGAGGVAGVNAGNNSNGGAGGAGGTTAFSLSGTRLAYWEGASGGAGGVTGGAGGSGGSDFTFGNISTPGGNGASQNVANNAAGSASPDAAGAQGLTRATQVSNGGGGGASFGDGGTAGLFVNSVPEQTDPTRVGGAGTVGAGGGGGGGSRNSSGVSSAAGGAGGDGKIELHYWQTVNS